MGKVVRERMSDGALAAAAGEGGDATRASRGEVGAGAGDAHAPAHVPPAGAPGTAAGDGGHPPAQSERERNSLVQQAIAEVLPSDDPFDEQNFDATKLINSYFPTEQSLHAAEAVADRLAVQMGVVDQQILQAVERQSSAGEQAKVDLEQANGSVSKLTEGLKRIGAKSARTEATVRAMCSDIQSLDLAKRNLTLTITVLRRLNMLETALEQLEDMTKERAYREAANLLEAVLQLASNFETFKSVPRICEILSSVRAVRSQLQAQVTEEFKLHIAPVLQGQVQAMLADAALVVSVLGPAVVTKLVLWFCAQELQEYEQLFDPSKASATLDGVERRYVWLRKWLRGYGSAYSEVFPESWSVQRCLCEEFCVATRRHFGALLQKASKELDVRLLLHVIQRTLDLEKELTARFAGAPDVGGAGAGERLQGARGGDFGRMVSGVFKPYMPLYLKLERAHMSDLVKKLIAEETWGPKADAGAGDDDDDDDLQVLHSSGELLIYIKRSLLQCKEVDTGETMVLLARAFGETLVKYAEQLHKHVASLAHRGKQLPPKDELACGYVVNTCEYCGDTTEQLHASVAKHLDPQLAESVSYASVSDAFDQALNAGLTAVVSSCLIKLDAAMAPLARIRWGELESVGDQSGYVGACQAVLRETAPPLRTLLSGMYFGVLCDRVATGFFQRFQASILKLKRVSDAGVQQLLLDTHALKTVLLELPSMGINKKGGGGDGGKKSKSYAKLVASESGQIEALLKVLLSPPEQVEANYRAMIKGGSLQQLQRILEIKGVRTTAPQALDVLEETRAAGQAQLQTLRDRVGLDSANFKSNFDSFSGKVVGQVAKAAGL